MAVDIVSTRARDAEGQQVHRVRVTWTNASTGDVAEIERSGVAGSASHIPGVCTLVGVAVYGDAGTMASRQPDLHVAAIDQSSVPAGSRLVYQSTSTVVANQIGDFDLGPNGAPVVLAEDESVYARLQPNTASDNGATMDLFFLPNVGA